MPPWLDSPEEVGALAVTVLSVLGVIAGAVVGVVAAVVAAWRTKVKPLLTKTSSAAEHAAEQLTPNHGSSARDSLGRIEQALDRLDRTVNQRFADVRADMRSDRVQNHQDHANIFRRLHTLESPPEDTQ